MLRDVVAQSLKARPIGYRRTSTMLAAQQSQGGSRRH